MEVPLSGHLVRQASYTLIDTCEVKEGFVLLKKLQTYEQIFRCSMDGAALMRCVAFLKRTGINTLFLQRARVFIANGGHFE